VKKITRFDQGRIERIFETSEGFLKGDGIVTRTGVFTYVNQDGSLRKELRHPDDVFSLDSLNSLEMIPITNDHPSALVTTDNAKQLSVGTTGENIRPDGKFLVSSVIIRDKGAIEAINNGKRELSLGYTVDLEDAPGEYGGERYDFRQRNIKYNHLAIVIAARAGNKAKLKFDSINCDYAIEQLKKEDNKDKDNSKQKNKEKIMVVKVDCGDGLNYDASPEVANLVKNLTRLNTGLVKKFDSLTDEYNTLKSSTVTVVAERDDFKDKFEKLEKADNSEAISEAADALLKLRKVADSVLDDKTKKKLDTMSESEIKKACVLAKYPNINKDSDDAYVSARFDILCEDSNCNSTAINDQRRKAVPNIKKDNDDLCDADQARNDAFKKMQEAHENKE